MNAAVCCLMRRSGRCYQDPVQMATIKRRYVVFSRCFSHNGSQHNCILMRSGLFMFQCVCCLFLPVSVCVLQMKRRQTMEEVVWRCNYHFPAPACRCPHAAAGQSGHRFGARAPLARRLVGCLRVAPLARRLVGCLRGVHVYLKTPRELGVKC